MLTNTAQPVAPRDVHGEDGAESTDSDAGFAWAEAALGVEDAPPVPVLAPGTTVAGIFVVEEMLGSGGTGAVYRVNDTVHGEPRALKIVQPTSVLRQKLREFRVLARLSHPGCVRVHDVGNDPEVGPYLVMDLVEGRPPTEVLEPGDNAHLLIFAQKVFETLAYLHERGIVHGDLKPDNVRCIDGDPTQPMLLDFGMAGEPVGDELNGGTVRYMAPELLRRQPRDARADLYAAGVMLYELAQGATPFAGETVAEVVRGHLEVDAPLLTTVVPGIDPGLSRLVDRLLRKAPGERPATARQVLSELAEVMGTDLAVAEAPDDASLLIGAPTLVGRSDALGRFDARLGVATTGTGAALWFQGPEGSGRTRLLDELAIRARLADARVVRWVATDLLGPAEVLVRGLIAVLRELPASQRTEMRLLLDGLTGREAASVGRADATELRLAGRTGHLLTVLHALAREGPLVVLIDDLDEAGPLAARVIAGLARGVGMASLVLVVAGGESSDLPAADVLEAVPLSPLDRAAMAEFVRTSLGQVNGADALVDWLAEESAGNPAAALETVHWLVTTGRLRLRRGRWYVAGDLGMATAAAGESVLRRLAERRLDLIPPEARGFLRVAAVMGQTFDPEFIDRAIGMPPPADEALLELWRLHLLAPNVEGAWPLRFGQTALRQMLADELAETDRRRLHSAFASALIDLAGGDSASELDSAGLLGDVARHLLGSGHWRRGGPLARQAAARWLLDGAYARSRALLQAALEALPDGDAESSAERVALETAFGDLLRQVGRFEEAREAFERGLAMAAGAVAAGLRVRIGHVAIAKGNYEEGRRTLETVLADRHAEQADRLEAAYYIGHAAQQQGHWERAWAAAEQARSEAEATGDPWQRARVRKLRGNICWASGRWEAALDEDRQALEGFRAVIDRHGEAEAEMSIGTALRHLARYDEALEGYEEALKSFRRMGLLSMVGKCENNMAIVHYYRGDYRRATDRFEAFLQVLEQTGERVERMRLLNNLGSVYRERGLFARSEALLLEGLQLARESDSPRVEAMILGNLGDTLLRAGRWDEARGRLRATITLSRAIGAKDEEIEAVRRSMDLVALHEPEALDITAIRETIGHAAEIDLRLELGNLHRLLSMALRRDGDLVGATTSVRTGLGALQDTGAALELLRLEREEALVLAAHGQIEEARARLKAELAQLSRMDAGWDLEQTAQALGAVSAQPSAQTGRLGEEMARTQLAAVVEFARRIDQIHDLQTFLDDTLKRIMELVPADRGLVIAFDRSGRPVAKTVRRADTDAPDEKEVAFSRSITLDAHRLGETIIVPVASADSRYRTAQSVGHLGLRTVVAVPIKSEGRNHGVIYVDSRTPCDAALEASVPLLEALTAIMGASLAHAELVERERARTEAMAFVVHELKTPLTSIYGYVQLMRMDADQLPDEMQSHLMVAADELGRLNRMVVDLNKLARLEHHDTLYTVVSVQVAELLDSVARNLAGLWRARNIVVSSEVPDELPLVIGNRDQLIQVVTNLLSNAIKFSPDGGEIRLSARRVSRAIDQAELGPPVPPSRFLASVQDHVSRMGEVEISVHDSGPGIPPEALDRIFRKFGQAGPDRSRSQGLGLGLAIARHIVERHAGRIWAENAPYGGAIFRFTLPALEDAAFPN
jgi:signal transduction histidine kinase/tetratricopeptide (TPR) repeat protein